MARKASTLTFVRGRVARVTRLDAFGRIVRGEDSQAVTEGIITISFTANTTETPEISVTNMNGKRCVFEPALPELSGYSIEAQFCSVEPEVFEIITGMPLVFDAAGKVVGIEVDTKIKLSEQGFGFELFLGSTGDLDDPEAAGEYGYILLPRLQGGILGDFTVENGAVNFTITGASTRDGNQWGRGPYAVEADGAGVAGPLYQAVSPTAALRMQTTSVTPPVPTGGARPLLVDTLPNITAITSAEGASDMEADLTVTPTATGPVWWEFGDGTWDYVAAPGGTDHLFERPGTYTVRATQNGRVFAEKTVTVPFP